MIWGQTATTVFSKCRQVIQRVPGLKNVGKTMVKPLVELQKALVRSRMIAHPYIQLERGFVFIHITKTAGTSLSHALGLEAPLDSYPHAQARDVMPYIRRRAPNVIALSFVRNPYTRFLSLYNFARMDESLYCSARNPESAPCGKHPDHDILSDKSLEQCAELLIQGKLNRKGWDPQVEWLIDKEGSEGTLMVDFIGRVESLDSDLARLHRIHQIAIKPVPWLNKSSGIRQDVSQWTTRTRDLVRLFYKRDFEMLGYDE
jgi:hypothetical protein